MLFTFSVSGWELINKKKSISKYSKECLYNMYKKINRTKTFASKPFLCFSSHILSGFGPIDPMSGRVGPPPAGSIKWLLDLVAVEWLLPVGPGRCAPPVGQLCTDTANLSPFSQSRVRRADPRCWSYRVRSGMAGRPCVWRSAAADGA